MGEFRIGRTRAQHSYPEPRRDTTVPFARNFAVGPATSTVVATGAGTQVPWAFIESGAPASEDVPITPKTTGIILIESVLSLKNSSLSPVFVVVQVQLNDTLSPFPALEAVTIPANGFMAIPILAEIPVALPVGVTANIEINVIASVAGVVTLAAESSSISLQEVPAATG